MKIADMNGQEVGDRNLWRYIFRVADPLEVLVYGKDEES